MKQIIILLLVVLTAYNALALTCIDGQYFDSGVCKACTAPCKTCSSATACLSCQSSLDYLLGDNCCPFFGIGPALMPCQLGYYHSKPKSNPCAWFSMGCTKCPDGCTSCDYEACYTCEEDYQLSEGQCLKPLTQIGIGIGPVKFCEDGQYPSSEPWNYTCLACPQGCATCDSAEVCNTCLDGYEKEGRYWCVVLNNGTNSSAQLIHFQEQPICDEGQFLDVDNSCKPCQKGCKSCEGKSFLCQTCEDGFEKEGRWCVKLQHNNSEIQFQQTCQDGFFMDSDGSCKPCSQGCATCSNATACITCLLGYEKEGRYWCIKQHNTTCPDGQFLSADGNCSICPQGCATCSSASVCQTCLLGYEKEGRYWCVKTHNEETQFQTIPIGIGPVKFCPQGKYPSSKPWDYSCHLCPQGCATCSSATQCGTCTKGYKKEGNNWCVVQD